MLILSATMGLIPRRDRLVLHHYKPYSMRSVEAFSVEVFLISTYNPGFSQLQKHIVALL